MLRMKRKAIPVTIEKQPSFAVRDKKMGVIHKMSWLYWFDPFDLVQTILNSTKIRTQMHVGLAEYRDEPTELWHSRAWGSSIRSVSGEVLYDLMGGIIIPGDIVLFNITGGFTKGSVIFIGRDFRSTAETPGDIVLTVQAVSTYEAMDEDLQDILDIPILDGVIRELYIIEDIQIDVAWADITYLCEVTFDRTWQDGDDTYQEPFTKQDEYFVRRVLNQGTRSCRPLHPTRGELEVEEFGREYLAANFDNRDGRKHSSFPFVLFIDDFGIHRNMYRALKAFYWIPAALPYTERRKLANVFTITLAPHGSRVDDVVNAISYDIRNLDKGGCLMDWRRGNDEVEQLVVCAFSMAIIGDMPQHADNSGFMRYNANYGCRSCFCPSKSRHDLSFDVVGEGRYYWQTVQDQANLNAQDTIEFARGLKKEEPAIAKLVPALDLILSRAHDAPHSEWRGLGRILQGRATILTPLILRSHGSTNWFRLRFLQAAAQTIETGNDFAPMEAIIWAYRVIAECNSIVGSQRYTAPEEVHRWLIKSRSCYQMLIRCAEAAGDRPSTDNSTTATDTDADASQPAPDQIIEEAIAEIDIDDPVTQATETEEADDDAPDDDDNDEAEVETARRKNKKGKRRGRGPNSKFQKLMNLPNVHVWLHIADVAREFATVMNCNVLPGEVKHNQYDNDELHVAIVTSLKRFQLDVLGTNFFRLRQRTYLPKLDSQHHFVRELIVAYERDYGVRRVVDLGRGRLIWKERIAYTDPTTKRRWVFNTGDYLLFHDQPTRLAQCFIHTYQGSYRVFFIANTVDRELLPSSGSPISDPVLNLDIFSVSRRQKVYGLPALKNEIQYYINARPNATWIADMDVAADDPREFLLECDWGVDYL
ncbi:MAG: hypothetical protein Q9200_007661 [Gallowayella weberi]